MTFARRAFACGLLMAVAAAGQKGPRFDAASVKPHPPTDREGNIGPFPGGFKATGVPLKLLIQIAYRLKDYQIAAGPSWIEEDHFDIEARAPRGMNPTHEQQGLMLQALLADRFGLRAHFETRELPAFALEVTKGGPKLTPAGANASGEPGLTLAGGYLKGRGLTAADLADALSQESDRAVVDRTGVSGKFDVTLKWNPDIRDPNGVPLVTALEEQLGLKLESVKAPVQVLRIDSVRKPSAN